MLKFDAFIYLKSARNSIDWSASVSLAMSGKCHELFV